MENEFGTNLDPNEPQANLKPTSEIGLSAAKFTLTQANLQGMTPDKAASDLRLARQFNMAPEFISKMTPEMKTQYQVEAIDWNEIENDMPVLYKKMNDMIFASLVKDDPRETGMLETLWWKMTPEDTVGSPRYNAFLRGLLSNEDTMYLVGNFRQLDALREREQDILDKERQLNAGFSPQQVFGDDLVAYEQFVKNKDSWLQEIEQQRMDAAISSAKVKRLQSILAHSKEYEDITKQEGFTNTVGDFLKNPSLIFEWGLESVAAQPLAYLATAGAMALGGPKTAMAVNGYMSYGLEKYNRTHQAMSENGLDMLNPDDIAKWYSPTGGYATEYERANKKARVAGAIIGAFDAMSVGLATTGLAKKFLASGAIKNPKLANLAELGIQAPAQGALGGSGEALSQIATEGRITSWADIVAEFGGEFMDAPGTIISTAVGRRAQVQYVAERVAELQQQTADLERFSMTAPLMATDPKSYSDYVKAVHEQRGTGTVLIDTDAVHEAGLDSLVGVTPELAQQFNDALARGEEMIVPTEVFLTDIAPKDTETALSAVVHPEGLPSFEEAKRMQEQVMEDTSKRLAETESNQGVEFRKSSANVGNRIATMLNEAFGAEDRVDQGGMPVQMQNTVTTYLQTLFAQTAKDLGMMPEEVFNKYGPTAFFSPQDVSFDENGKPVPISDRAKKAFASKDKAAISQASMGDFFPAIRAIGQWKGANRSTVLHELGHMFLNMRVAIANDLRASGAELTKGQKHLVDAIDGVMKWLGSDTQSFAKLSADEQRAMHEKFARTWEKYLEEGVAPNRALTVIFRQLSAWVRSAYRILKMAIPGAELNAETRVLFDNLLVASNEVEMAMERRNRAARINDPVKAATTIGALENLEDLRQEDFNVAVEMVQAFVNREATKITNMRKRVTKDLTEKAKYRYNQLYDENWKDLKKSATYKAYSALTNGVNGSHPKIVKAELEGLDLSKDEIEYLESAGMVGDGRDGTGEMIAKANGFDSVDAMVKALLEMRDPVDYTADKTTVRMLELFPDIASPEAIAHTADEAVVNDAYIESLSAEYRAMNAAMGDKKELKNTLTKRATAEVGNIKVKNLDGAKRFAKREENRNGGLANWARRHADATKEAAAKLHQLEQAIKFRVIGATQNRVVSFEKHCKRYGKAKTSMVINAEYLIAIQDLLTKIGVLKEFPPGGSNQRRSLAETIQENNENAVSYAGKNESGEEIIVNADRPFINVDKALVAKIDSYNFKLGDATVSEFNQIYDLVLQLNTIGHSLEVIKVNDEEIALEDVRNALSGSVEDTARGKGMDKIVLEEEHGPVARVKNMFHRIGAAHARVPMLLAALENAQSGHGNFFKYIVKGYGDAMSRYEQLNNQYTEALAKEILGPIFGKLTDTKKRYYEELDASLDFQAIFAMALNMGNEGNRNRLLNNTVVGSNRKKLTLQGVMSAIGKTLTEDDLKRVQMVWDLFADLRPLLEEKERRMTGRTADWVEPEPVKFTTKEGKEVTLEGGYYPIVYNPRAGGKAASREEAGKMQQALKAAQGRAQVNRSMEKSRAKAVEGEQPLSLTLRGITEGFSNTIHNICFDEWLMSTQRILNGKVEKSIIDYYDKPVYTAIRRWIKDIAQDGQPNTSLDDMASWFASGTAIMGVGFNLITAAIQVIGVTQSISVVGGKWIANGVGEVAKRGPMGALRYAQSKSAMMRDRSRTQFREISELGRLTSKKYERAIQGISRFAYAPIVFVQMCVDLPTWIGAYNRAISEGMEESSAVAVADRMLIDSQGSGRLGDLSDIERRGAVAKIFTTFYTFFNTTLNLVKYQTDTKGWKGLLTLDALMLLVFQPVAETFLREAFKIRGDDEDKDKYWRRMLAESVKNWASFNLNLVVGLRELAMVAEYANLINDEMPRFSYAGPTGMRMPADLAKALSASVKKDGPDEKALLKWATFLSEVAKFPFPAVPLNRFYSGMKAIEEGKTDNKLVYLTGFTDK